MDFFRESFLHLFAWLLIGHFIADFALQSDFLAQAKNRTTELGKMFWPYGLVAHATIHAAFVFLFTGMLTLAIAELILHAKIDDQKCIGKIDLKTDQNLHFACKLLWTVIAVTYYSLFV